MDNDKEIIEDTLYLTQKQQLKRLSSKEYIALKKLCSLSKNVYNVALYNIRQHFFNEKKYLGYTKNYHECKSNENYIELNCNMAQQTIKKVHNNFSSFFELLKLKNSGKYNDKVNIPRYLDKDGLFELNICEFSINDGKLDIPMSPKFKKEFGKITINVPKNLLDKKIKQIKIIPMFNGRFFEIQYTYEIELSQRKLNTKNALSIDLGVNNLATCVTNKGESFIIDGKKLKNYIQWYNKENARLQSIKDKQGITKLTRRQQFLIKKRNNRVSDYIHKSCRKIVNYCLENNIGTVVLGYNNNIQSNLNIGKVNNQNFVNMPISQMKKILEYLCKLYGIEFVEQEESYTSKADFFANDEIPIYDENKPIKYTFSGKRIFRGQYKSKTGYIFNADCNGALNIMKKCTLIDLWALQDRGILDVPKRIRIT